MNDYIRAYDANVRARARELTNLRSTAEIHEWFAEQDRPLDEGENAYAAAFGALQALTHELLREAVDA